MLHELVQNNRNSTQKVQNDSTCCFLFNGTKYILANSLSKSYTGTACISHAILVTCWIFHYEKIRLHKNRHKVKGYITKSQPPTPMLLVTTPTHMLVVTTPTHIIIASIKKVWVSVVFPAFVYI